MQYRLINDVLNELHQSTIVPLEALKPDANRYTVLAMQPVGRVNASEKGVFNDDQESAIAKHTAFLEMARHKNVDLAISPEYSCPWSVVSDALRNDLLPNAGKLWVIGCESISIDSLKQLKAEFPAVKWICDTPEPKGTQSFLDPICYFLCVNDEEGTQRTAVVVQLKTQPMSDTRYRLEQEYLIPGNTRYIIQNDDDSIRLLTIVCSDALDFNIEALENQQTRGHIIVHPQLCLDPLHNTFRAYRDAFRTSCKNHELVTLNWGKGFQINNLEPSLFGGTYHFIKSDEVDSDDIRISRNHQKGAYWGFWRTHRTTVTQFNFQESVFHYELSKPMQTGAVDLLARRQGIRMLDNYQWQDQTCQWEENNDVVDDGFGNMCVSIGQSVDPLMDSNICSIAKERLLAISTGDFERPPKSGWEHPRNLRSCQLTADEKCQRITVIQEPESDSFQTNYDKKYEVVFNFCFLRNSILGASLPKCIEDLSTGFVIRLCLNDASNVTNADGKYPATVAFIGNKSMARLTKTFDDIQSLLATYSLDDARKRRVVIWANVGGEITPKYLDDVSIDADLSVGGRSILKS